MTLRGQAIALRHVSTLFGMGVIGNLTDAQLLERFVSRRDETAELAFRALVERHGPMVLRVCRAELRNGHDAHDAFQVTFLVLARRAASLWVRDSLGPWLHQVAHRTACCARLATVRRRRHEQRAAELLVRTGDEGDRDDLVPVIHEEIGLLPERFRAAVVLCLLEGLTPEQAARHLNCPVGTVHSRLARGRERLRGRLTRRGVAGSAGLWAVGWARNGISAAVPQTLANSTIRAALRLVAGPVSVGAVPASVAALLASVSRSMLMAQVRMVGAALVTLGALAVGSVVLARQTPGAPIRTTHRWSKESDRTALLIESRSDEETIQGTWNVVSRLDNGREPPAKEAKLELRISRDTITVKVADRFVSTMTYRLGPAHEPKWIDLTTATRPAVPGIYALQGDELKICYNEGGAERPSKFASEANPPNDVLMTLKRETRTEEGWNTVALEPSVESPEMADSGSPRLSINGVAGNQVRIVVLGMGRRREVTVEPLADGTLRLQGEQGVLETKGLVLILGDPKRDPKRAQPPVGDNRIPGRA